MKLSRKTLGFILLLTPFPGLILTLSAYAVVSFVLDSMAQSGTDASGVAGIGQLINVLLGFFGILCVLGILIGMPTGLVLLLTSGPKKQPNPSQLPPNVQL